MKAQSQDLELVPPKTNSLRTDGLVKIDKTRFVDAYVNSQRSFSKLHAEEGRAAFASRKAGTPELQTTPPAKIRSRGVDVPAVFDTPILKPRAAHEVRSTSATNKKQGKHKEKEQRAGTHDRVRSGETRPEQTKASSFKKRSTESTRQQTLDDVMKPNKTWKSGSEAVKKTSKKRPHSPDTTDEEHAARLAERRERRRTKRAIVEPQHLSDEDDEDEPAIGHGVPLKKTKKGKAEDRKGKRLSLTAGLALMHGFHAKNIGRNRLTSNPEQRPGVFNKGKASTKVPVQSLSTKRKATGLIFSEVRFLGKSGAVAGKSTEAMSDEVSVRSSSADSSSSSITQSRTRRVPTEKCSKTSRRIHKRYMTNRSDKGSDSSVQYSDDEQISSVGTGALTSRLHVRKTQSVIWDIELEGHSLSSSQASDQASQSQRDGTMVLDTRGLSWNMNRHASVDDMKSKSVVSSHVGEEQPIGPRQDVTSDRLSHVSLGPSQSASQTGNHTIPMLTASRFFSPVPESVQRHSIGSNDIGAVFQAAHVEADCPLDQSKPPSETPSSRQPARVLKDNLSKHPNPAQGQLEGRAVAHSPPTADSFISLECELRALDGEEYVQDCTTQPMDCLASLLDLGDPMAGNLEVDVLGYYGDVPDDGDLAVLALSVGNSLSEGVYADLQPGDYDDGGDRFYEPLEPQEYAQTYHEGSWREAWNEEMPDFENARVGSNVVLDSLHGHIGTLDMEVQASTFSHHFGCENVGPDADGYCASIQVDETSAMPDDDLASNATSAIVPPRSSQDQYLPGGQIMSSSGVSLTDESTSQLPLFSQGRALLMGLSERDNPYGRRFEHFESLSSAEVDVAKSLRGHWLPYRP